MLLHVDPKIFQSRIMPVYILICNKNFLFFILCRLIYNRRIMKNMLKKLIQAQTTADKGELAAARIISDELSRFGIESRIENWDNTRANIIAHVKSSGQKGALLFACHLDVVPAGEVNWSNPAFTAIENDGKIYGRGSADMKGGIAAIVTAIGQIVDSGTKLQGDIILFGAAGEETDSCGTRRFVCDAGWLPELAGAVITEPTDFKIITAHRGMLWLKLQTFGRSAHSSTPHLGVNAITSMRAVLNELENYKIPFERHKLLGECSMSINTIAGGEAINVVPDKCTIEIDIRTVSGQNHQDIIDDLQKIFEKLKQKNPQFDAAVSIIRQVQALETDTGCDFVKDFCSAVGINETTAVGFTTDGPYFASLSVPVVIFGPGKPDLAHQPDEYIDISDLKKGMEYYKSIILKFLT
jgi:succinyl-diaminopimelate desuccinylase